MPNLVGIGLSQVPTNSMLGGMAYQDPEHASIKNLDLKNLSQINSEIADTATDIFVYDTRKDSDGGDWRKRTQDKSWYNETLNTATRGSRKEFPAVAVIVAESNPNKVTIYDGDDPDLPMWMVFNASTNSNANFLAVAGQTLSSIFILNGDLCIGFPSANGWGISRINFLSDSQDWYWNSATIYKQVKNSIAERNEQNGYYNTTTGVAGLASARVNDITMTVLPNAPIDDATGLPIPTIALATNGGVSIIKDDGTVFDVIDSNGARKCYDVSFTKDHKIMHTGDLGAGSTHAGNVFVTNILTADRGEYDNNSDLYRWYSTSTNYPRINGGNTFNTRVLDPIDVGGDHYAMADVGISLIEDGTSSSYGNTDGMVAYITSDYNSGYQHGDIKCAFLSDTDATNVSATNLNLITNGDFSSGTSGWSNDATPTFTVSGGVASVDRNGGSATGQCYQTITTEVGRTYTVSVLVSAVSDGFQVYAGEAPSAANITMSEGAVNATGTHYWTFTATSTSTRLDFSATQNSTGTASFDNITIFDGAADRSVNNKGLAVFGTVTRTAVATGADLVAYSGFSASNYLQQPYNSGLDFGTGDFSFMAWIYPTNDDSGGIISRGSNGVYGPYAFNYSTERMTFVCSSDWNESNDGGSWGTLIQSASGTVPHNVWTHVVAVKIGTLAYVYINGVLMGTDTSAVNPKVPTSNFVPTMIGVERTPLTGAIGRHFPGSLALVRASASAPSAEQVKKMYEDEKVLFQENAKATLYGSSDAVTALAFDDTTNLLHVGTSSGRSEFQGLRRINNTTDAVTTAISASNGLVAEQ